MASYTSKSDKNNQYQDVIRDIARDILRQEGGFVNDPDDLGGATKHGVTLSTLQRLGFDVTQDGRVTIDDVKNLSQEDALHIFVQEYFYKPRVHELPELLWASVFDMSVNAGSNAVKILQRLLNEMGMSLKVDGQIGPKTIDAAKHAARLAPRHLADAYAIERREYYYRLGDKRARNRKFAQRKNGGKGGWITRAEAFMDAKYHFTLLQHQKRTASWG